jgi:hypothetical protein
MHRVLGYAVNRFAAARSEHDPDLISIGCRLAAPGTVSALVARRNMTEREAKSRAVKILAKSIYRDLEAQGFDEKQIIALATELISEVTSRMSRTDKAQQLA